jgi:hypothetical protein
MNYKDIAVKNEQRLKVLLYNAIVLIEETYCTEEDVHKYILDNLGMTEKEYNKIMGVNE